MRASRIDSNQQEIVSAFRNLGYSVAHTHTVKDGFPDIVVAKHNVNYLVEIKNSLNPKSKKKLTPDQVIFHGTWKGPIIIVESINCVILFDKFRSQVV